MEAKERQYYVLLSALCTTYTQSIDQQIAKWINPHYLKVLEYIRKHEGVKPSELAEVFRMSKSNVTKIVSYFVGGRTEGPPQPAFKDDALWPASLRRGGCDHHAFCGRDGGSL